VTLVLDILCRWLDRLSAAALAVMVVLVFGNVVLRYGFNTGITVSEELARLLFVWMTFMGAVAALKDRAHLGTEMLTARLGTNGRRLCLALTQIGMFFVCALVAKGAWEQTRITWDNTSAVMQIPVAWQYAPGLLFALLSLVIIGVSLGRTLGAGWSGTDGSMVRESEDEAHPPAR